jgi:hypothetical protein
MTSCGPYCLFHIVVLHVMTPGSLVVSNQLFGVIYCPKDGDGKFLRNVKYVFTRLHSVITQIPIM